MNQSMTKGWLFSFANVMYVYNWSLCNCAHSLLRFGFVLAPQEENKCVILSGHATAEVVWLGCLSCIFYVVFSLLLNMDMSTSISRHESLTLDFCRRIPLVDRSPALEVTSRGVCRYFEYCIFRSEQEHNDHRSTSMLQGAKVSITMFLKLYLCIV